jgi:hypothetical protein
MQSLPLFAPVPSRQPKGHFFGYFLWGLAKKVSRLPAGTGELDFAGFACSTQYSAFSIIRNMTRIVNTVNSYG